MLLLVSVVSMVLALISYSIGVWGEKLGGSLKPWNLIFFWTGLTFDTTGTTIMGIMSGKLVFSLHGVTGLAAIVLMVFHALWATFILVRKDDKMAKKFHKFSLGVWGLWLIPFFTGMILNM